MTVSTPLLKTWLITGASSGIGLNVTKQLLQDGHKVIALVRSPQKLQAFTDQYPTTLNILKLDLTQTEKIAPIVECAFQHAGRIDVLLNAAGYALVGAAEELNDNAISTQITTNLLAPIYLTKAALPYFRKQKTGHILHISSEGGQITYPSASIYHASKWGAEGFFESLAKEVQNLGIKVTLIEPGRIKTEFDNNAVITEPQLDDYRKTTVGTYFRLLAMGRFPMIGDPAKVAQMIIKVSTVTNPPLRLILGSDSYKNIIRETENRLQAAKEQQKTAKSTDIKFI